MISQPRAECQTTAATRDVSLECRALLLGRRETRQHRKYSIVNVLAFVSFCAGLLYAPVEFTQFGFCVGAYFDGVKRLNSPWLSY